MRWIWATLRRRGGEAAAAALAVALLVSYVGAVGEFVAATRAGLSERAAARVPVDWQVQVTASGDPRAVSDAVRAVPGVTGVREVDMAIVPGLQHTAGGSTHTTAKSYFVSLPDDYVSFAPAELRPLLGAQHGVLLQQQTAANLAATVGDRVAVVGGPKANAAVTVNGIVDLPAADSFFQVVGAPSNAGASAPPDNVLVLPRPEFDHLTAGQVVIHQIHARFDRANLPADPGSAAAAISGRANRLAVTLAGGALVADNLGAALSAAREDAIYARLLVVLLALPGVALAATVTALVVALRRERARHELAVLRMRGATPLRAAALVGSPGLLVAVLGIALGVAGAHLAARLALGHPSPMAGTWLIAGAVTGLIVAVASEMWPVVRMVRPTPEGIAAGTIAAEVGGAPPSARLPLPLRLGLDIVFLAGSGLVLWLSSRNGYQVVVVPEGLPVASVNYGALLAPALAWPGFALLTWRITSMALNLHRRRPRTDPAGRVPDLRVTSLRRRRRLVARGATGLAIAVGLVVSTASFAATYDQQARLDVALTVGSDAAVTVPPDTADPGLDPARAAAVTGVRHVEPMLHRLTYVGPDLQDLYGVHTDTIGAAAPLLDAFTPGQSVRAAMTQLGRVSDGALVSQETLHDYQLHPGDLLRLRLQGPTGDYHVVPFHVLGAITEFATAPRDSFVVANYDYVAKATGRAAPETLLVRSRDPEGVGERLRAQFSAPGMTVSDIATESATVTSASGLAATDLSGLSHLGIGFGVPLAVASAVLALVVGVTSRARAFAALGILGATGRQRAAFLRTEAWALLVAGLTGGLLVGFAMAYELVKVLTGIFDPPPQHLAAPWTPLIVVILAVATAGALAIAACTRWVVRLGPNRLRDY